MCTWPSIFPDHSPHAPHGPPLPYSYSINPLLSLPSSTVSLPEYSITYKYALTPVVRQKNPTVCNHWAFCSQQNYSREDTCCFLCICSHSSSQWLHDSMTWLWSRSPIIISSNTLIICSILGLHLTWLSSIWQLIPRSFLRCFHCLAYRTPTHSPGLSTSLVSFASSPSIPFLNVGMLITVFRSVLFSKHTDYLI